MAVMIGNLSIGISFHSPKATLLVLEELILSSFVETFFRAMRLEWDER